MKKTTVGALQNNGNIFWATFIATFSIVSLQLLGVKAPKIFASPLPQQQQKVDVFTATVMPLLETKESKFSLKQPSSLVSSAHAAGEYDNAAGYSVIDLDSGEVLLEKNMSEKFLIASVTKVMTAVVALDLAEPTEEFAVTANAASMVPTKIGADEGERLTLHELLHAILLTSANDAAEVIKDGIDAKYGEGTFIKAMNAKAAFLGLTNTHFTNAQGFDHPMHYSTPAEVALFSQYAMTQYPLIAEIAKKDYEFLAENPSHGQYDLYNWNGLIGVYPNVTGLKIGNTDGAKKTTVVIAEREGKKLLVVLLGAPGILERDMWAASLLDAGFAKSKNLPAIAITEDQLREKYATWKYWN